MATVYSNNAYLTNKIGQGSTAIPAVEAEGRVKQSSWFFATASGAFSTALDGTAASFAAGDTVILAKIPAGSKILKADICFSASQTTAQYSLGLAAADGSGAFNYSTAAAPNTIVAGTDSTTLVKAATVYGTTADFVLALPSTGIIVRSDVFLTMTNSVAAVGAGNVYGTVYFSAP